MSGNGSVFGSDQNKLDYARAQVQNEDPAFIEPELDPALVEARVACLAFVYCFACIALGHRLDK